MTKGFFLNKEYFADVNEQIVFEKIKAYEKSTSIKKTIKYLKTKKIKYVSFREPGGTNLSEKLRSLMLNKKIQQITLISI